LDAGSGDGRGAALLAARDRQVIAIDYRPSPLVPPGITVAQGDLTALGAENGSFPGIACLDVLDEVDEVDTARAIVAEFRRTLAPDGVLTVSIRRSRAAAPSPGTVEALVRDAFPGVEALDCGPLVIWRAGSGSAVDHDLLPGRASSTFVGPLPARRFLVASASRIPPLPCVELPGPPLDLAALHATWEGMVQLVRGLRADLTAAREDLQQVQDLRAHLVEAEQELSSMPTLRSMLRTLVAERDGTRELLRSYLRRRPYPQLATALEAFRDADIQVGDEAREALHVLLTELDRRPDLRSIFVVNGEVRMVDFVRWALAAYPNDCSTPLLRRHLPALSLLSERIPRGELVLVRVLDA
jgi:hypothetical protein